MSFLRKLFGGGKSAEGAETQVGETVEYKGCTIRATPFPAEGQYQTCGVIARIVDGETKEHRFVRADRFPSAEAAADMALRKGRQLIDEQGDGLFA